VRKLKVYATNVVSFMKVNSNAKQINGVSYPPYSLVKLHLDVSSILVAELYSLDGSKADNRGENEHPCTGDDETGGKDAQVHAWHAEWCRETLSCGLDLCGGIVEEERRTCQILLFVSDKDAEEVRCLSRGETSGDGLGV
jgi:hypothetical protein